MCINGESAQNGDVLLETTRDIEDGFLGDVYLVGKACHPAQGRPRLTPKALAEDVAASLRRLKGAQHLDLLLLHRDDPNVPAKEACVGAWLCACLFH